MRITSFAVASLLLLAGCAGAGPSVEKAPTPQSQGMAFEVESSADPVPSAFLERIMFMVRVEAGGNTQVPTVVSLAADLLAARGVEVRASLIEPDNLFSESRATTAIRQFNPNGVMPVRVVEGESERSRSEGRLITPAQASSPVWTFDLVSDDVRRVDAAVIAAELVERLTADGFVPPEAP